ncbi:hypothetical protein AMECASPLE_037795 [Ameca splendens]|uniref:Uncharacterized protein n=1 Tax=Ameca splendens TaxID=208324 RepID=A0ABV0XXC8_9TELE
MCGICRDVSCHFLTLDLYESWMEGRSDLMILFADLIVCCMLYIFTGNEKIYIFSHPLITTTSLRYNHKLVHFIYSPYKLIGQVKEKCFQSMQLGLRDQRDVA